MADAHGLGPCVLIGRGGSTPLPGTGVEISGIFGPHRFVRRLISI